MVADKPTDNETTQADDGATDGAPRSTPIPNPLAPAARAKGEAAQRRTVFRPEIVRRTTEYSGPSTRSNAALGGFNEGKTLVVGREISLCGAISACEKLVVEGRVEANMSDCREIEVADGGTFKGEAEIEVAEIKGSFEGTLIARELLMVRASGRVSGKIRFGRLEVERGGRIEGDVAEYAPGGDSNEDSGSASSA
jgi:cytoskeletal protein CcmA (bactofilin family)